MMTTQEEAQDIMGRNYFGIRQGVQYFHVNPTQDIVDALREVPFSRETLEDCKDTHVLVAIFPLSILDINGMIEQRIFVIRECPWYIKEDFAKDRGETGWCLVRKTPVPGSTSKEWDEQLALLGENEEIPSAQIMVYTIVGHYFAEGERLFKDVCVLTSSDDSNGDPIGVDNFEDRLAVQVWGRGGHSDHVGVASVRKPDL